MEDRDRTRRGEPEKSEKDTDPDARPPKRAARPAPGVKHVPEPDAENIMPAEDEPGTL